MSDDGRPIRASLAGICPLCGASLDLNSTACRRCGVTPKRVGPCVHCKSTSSVRPHAELGWVCEICGGARLAHPALEVDTSVQAPLAAATRDHRKARLLRAASGAGTVFTGLSLLTMLLLGVLFSPGGTAMTAFALVPLLFLIMTVVAIAGAKNARAKTTLELEQAQTAALVKLLADFPDGALASQLASSLQISHSRAEQLLTRLNVRDDIQSMVADDGQLLFRLRNGDEVSSDPFAPPAKARLRLPADEVPTSSTDANRDSPIENSVEEQQRAEGPSTKEAR